jgi:hypothetical protein
MGYTIGDVLTIIGFIFGILVSIWALLVGFALLFPKKARAAQEEIETSPWLCFFTGLFTYAAGIVIVLLFLNLHNPFFTLIGWSAAIVMLALSVVGGSGLSLLAGKRIQQMDRRRSQYRALERGALLLVVGSLLPVFGWFAFAPLVINFSLGAGALSVIFRRNRAPRYVDAPTYSQPAADAQAAANAEFLL